MCLFVASQSMAQAPPPPPPAGGIPGAPGEGKAPGLAGPRKQLATIVFAGLGGAILGLSTLSFYGRPQEKLTNIAIGFAFGIMAGTVLVTYRAVTNPQELYGLTPETPNSLRLLAASSEEPSGNSLGLRSSANWAASWQFQF
jgi:hypothetical protein